jgi:hypothetical protein
LSQNPLFTWNSVPGATSYVFSISTSNISNVENKYTTSDVANLPAGWRGLVTVNLGTSYSSGLPVFNSYTYIGPGGLGGGGSGGPTSGGGPGGPSGSGGAPGGGGTPGAGGGSTGGSNGVWVYPWTECLNDANFDDDGNMLFTNTCTEIGGWITVTIYLADGSLPWWVDLSPGETDGPGGLTQDVVDNAGGYYPPYVCPSQYSPSYPGSSYSPINQGGVADYVCWTGW